jgi:hypothetical protein
MNIIDYMEISDNFYAIGGWIKDIFTKLQDGIAIIAMQKNKGVDLGRGGGFSLEKPRLYLSMDAEFPGHKVKIIKCKNWRNEQINPNGLAYKFKLIGGAKIHTMDSWQREI